MKKVFDVEDLDCANCAAKIENSISKIEGVTSVSVSFITQKITLEADDSKFDKIVKEMVKVCEKVEPDMTVLNV